MEYKKQCFKCGKRAYHRFSPDLDISGLGACKRHLKSVQHAYAMLLGNNELYDELTKGWWGTKDIEDSSRRSINHVTGESLTGEKLDA